MTRTSRIALITACGALAMPAAAGAATDRFHRFEVDATADYLIEETCADGTTASQRVAVIAGHEEESESGASTLDNDFATVLIRGFDCDGAFVNARGSGPAQFSWSPSLRTASVSGTITTRDGHDLTVDIDWSGTGSLETTSNTTTFPGFTGHFKGQRRDAVATGTVVFDGDTIVDATTTDAEIETLEDTNISRP
ncbi:MAG: hypothetical protein QOI73_3099 [Solirubrobacteraceae bacterium]|nr:hypothetical protein [Solirubrobacteraceae bacterium]